ncbi:MAG: DUF3301 domain-containing protein [Gallionella sp.]|nr:DUF3301 domain-containing protein [Gallionella sp.]
MDVASLLLLLLLAALGWFWFVSLSALEVARAKGKRVCDDANVQFLDDTVANISLALVRDKAGSRVLRRTYRFEFSETGDSRLEGRLVMLGRRVESVTLEPYQILSCADIRDAPQQLPSACSSQDAHCPTCRTDSVSKETRS